MKNTSILLLTLILIPSVASASLPEKNRSKDVPPTLVITSDGGKLGATDTPVPVIHNDKPNKKYAQQEKFKPKKMN